MLEEQKVITEEAVNGTSYEQNTIKSAKEKAFGTMVVYLRLSVKILKDDCIYRKSGNDS